MNETPGSSPRPLLIELGGEIDLRNAQALDDALCEAIDRTRAELLVDLSASRSLTRPGSGGWSASTSTRRRGTVECGGWESGRRHPRVAAAAGLDHVLHFERSRPTSSDEAHAGRGMSTLDNADVRQSNETSPRLLGTKPQNDATLPQRHGSPETGSPPRRTGWPRHSSAREPRASSRSFTPTPEHVRDNLTGVLSRGAGHDQLDQHSIVHTEPGNRWSSHSSTLTT